MTRRRRRRLVLSAAVVAVAAWVNRDLFAGLGVRVGNAAVTGLRRIGEEGAVWLPRAFLLLTAAGVLLAAANAVYLFARRGARGPAWAVWAAGAFAGRPAGLAELNADDTGRLLEELVGRLLDDAGCEVLAARGGAGDKVCDGLAVGPDGQRVVVQRKAVDRTIGAPQMYEFNGTVWSEHGADIALYVTTSRFTLPALRFARRHGIHTVDGAQLTAWVAGEWSPVAELFRSYPRAA